MLHRLLAAVLFCLSGHSGSQLCRDVSGGTCTSLIVPFINLIFNNAHLTVPIYFCLCLQKTGVLKSSKPGCHQHGATAVCKTAAHCCNARMPGNRSKGQFATDSSPSLSPMLYASPLLPSHVFDFPAAASLKLSARAGVQERILWRDSTPQPDSVANHLVEDVLYRKGSFKQQLPELIPGVTILQ